MTDDELERLMEKSRRDAYFRGLEEAALQSQKGLPSPKEKDYPGSCDMCGKKMRPFSSDADDYPEGTPRRARRGACDSCDAAARRAARAVSTGGKLTERQRKALEPQHGKRRLEMPSHCRVCHLPMRPAGSKKADYPDGHYAHAGRGRCERCYRAERATREVVPRQKRPANCVSCGIRLVAAKTPPDVVPVGAKRYGGKGRCKSCYIRELRSFDKTP